MPSGNTASERYLKRLCDRSFLSLWSHPNVYKDQRINGPGTDGKEVCDLLVVFGNRIVIFSDKDCAFPDTGDLNLDWNRWYRRAIDRSAKQLMGAERWIKQHPTRLYIDSACTQSLPVPIPDPSQAIFHRVLVAHGAARRCARELGGIGSLMVEISGRVETPGADCGSPDPFTIVYESNAEEIVHVFDDTTIQLVLGKLDTIADFSSYLDKKEQFIRSGVSAFAAGEEDLLAYYLWHLNERGEHDFVFASGFNAIMLEEGYWQEFQRSSQRRAQMEADRISYAWDWLIETISEDLRAGRLRQLGDTHSEDGERILRCLAGESRFRRRMLARPLVDLITMRDDKVDRYARTVPSTTPGDPYYLFMTLRQPDFIDEETYRDVRVQLLDDYCKVLRWKYPAAHEVIGIATEYGGGRTNSFDLVFQEGAPFSAEEQKQVRDLAVQFRLYQDTQVYRFRELEYPEGELHPQPVPNMKGRMRNQPCPCGSGIKFKLCCGKRRVSISKRAGIR